MTDEARNILVVAHGRRPDTVGAAARVIGALRDAGATPVLSSDDRAELDSAIPGPLATLGADVAVADIELAIVLGGDGTITLQPANPRYQPQTYPPEMVRIQGELVASLSVKYPGR